jgi:hypothetical protein
MADLAVTAAAVRGTRGATAPASLTIAAGKVCYTDSATNKYALSDNNVVAAAKVEGIALHSADLDQPLTIHTAGDLTMNAILTAGTFYYLSATPGSICPVADLTSGSRVIQIGYAKSTTVLAVSIVDTGIVLP